MGTQAYAQDTSTIEQKHYQDCMIIARSHPQSALDNAKAWEGVGGGMPARHCHFAALMQLGHYAQAARGFEDLASELQTNVSLKAQLYGQSANAWLVANNPGRAQKVLQLVLSQDPNNNTALLLNAKALELLGKPWEAADDLTRLLYQAPGTIDAILLRGDIYQKMGANDLALNDFSRALTLQPNNSEALLARGLIHFDNHNLRAARADWQALINANPDIASRQQAEKYLQRLRPKP